MMAVRLYFVHPLQQDDRRIGCVVADDGGIYDDAPVSRLFRVRQFITDQGREIDMDGSQDMMVPNANIAAILIDKETKEAQ